MNMPVIEELNKQFSFTKDNQNLSFSTGEGGIPVIEVKNTHATAKISLQGAHVLSWIPTGEDEVIWLSDDAKFAPGKSVRGGIPVCWPWFGPHESNSAYPAHGYARTVMWPVTKTQALASGEIEITFTLDTLQLDKQYQDMWPAHTIVEYKLTISKTLTMDLTTINKSDAPFTIGEALHTYFKIDDIGNTSITGLENIAYLDKTDGFKRKIQSGAITIESEVDRVYVDTNNEVIIDDAKRKIIIKKQGSDSTVVWNPWQAVADKMGDLGKDGYRKMVCVESANAADNVVTINSGESHTLHVSYEV